MSAFEEPDAGELALISKWMLELGVPRHLNGYGYLREAIRLTDRDMSLVTSVTKLLYPMVAKEYGVTTSKVERAIRSAVEVSWTRGNCDLFEELFGYSRETSDNHPTNSEYIGRVSDAIRMNSAEEKYTF